MKELRISVNNDEGLHSRPAAMFVRCANRFSCHIELSNGENSVNAKSIIGVMSLGIGPGEEVLIKAEGQDEEAAVSQLKKIIEDKFKLG